MDYYEVYQNKAQIMDVRRAMVEYAMENGIKPTARKFNTSIKTVKKWVKRFREGSHEGAIK